MSDPTPAQWERIFVESAEDLVLAGLRPPYEAGMGPHEPRWRQGSKYPPWPDGMWVKQL